MTDRTCSKPWAHDEPEPEDADIVGVQHLRIMADDLRAVYDGRPNRPAAPFDDAYRVARYADDELHPHWHDRTRETVECILDGKYDSAADTLDELAEVIEHEGGFHADTRRGACPSCREMDDIRDDCGCPEDCVDSSLLRCGCEH